MATQKPSIPRKLFGRIYRPPTLPHKARMRAMWAKALPLPPASFDLDTTLKVAPPMRMYLNNVEGDCVIAARANQQTRFELCQTGTLLNISDDEVQQEYLTETGGSDTGLVPEDSLTEWQQQGWVAAGNRYNIAGWGRVDAKDELDVQRAIWMLQGCQFSLQLPLIWSDALDAGEPWDAPPSGSNGRAELGSWGGHQIVSFAYDNLGVYVLTWGQRQLITWAGLAWAGAEGNQGEAEAVVRADSSGDAAAIDGLDSEKLLSELADIDEAV